MRLVTAHRELGQWQPCVETAEHALGLLEAQNDKAKAGNLHRRQKFTLEGALTLGRTKLDTSGAETGVDAHTIADGAENNAPMGDATGENCSSKKPTMALQSQLRNLAALMERNQNA